MKKNIAIIDYGVGNVQSVKEAMASLDCDVIISDDPEKLNKADALILPGVGAFETAMNNLKDRELVEALNEMVMEKKKPLLGICLGMQLFADESEENGLHEGLGWVKGTVRRIQDGPNLRVPHVGWNDIDVISKSPMFDRLQDKRNFYFDHSYHFICDDEMTVAAKVHYGKGLNAAVQKENIFGVQFHPEKSQITGLRLLKGFLNSI